LRDVARRRPIRSEELDRYSPERHRRCAGARRQRDWQSCSRRWRALKEMRLPRPRKVEEKAGGAAAGESAVPEQAQPGPGSQRRRVPVEGDPLHDEPHTRVPGVVLEEGEVAARDKRLVNEGDSVGALAGRYVVDRGGFAVRVDRAKGGVLSMDFGKRGTLVCVENMACDLPGVEPRAAPRRPGPGCSAAGWRACGDGRSHLTALVQDLLLLRAPGAPIPGIERVTFVYSSWRGSV